MADSMPTWVDTGAAIEHIRAAEKIETLKGSRAPRILHELRQSGRVATRATTRGGEPLAVPQILPAEHWNIPFEKTAWNSVATMIPGTFKDKVHPESLGGIEYCLDDLRRECPLHGAAPLVGDALPSGLSRHAGRKPKLNWNEVFGEALRRVYLTDIPESDHAFADEMQSWCSEKYGVEVANSTMRDNVAKWLRPIRNELRRR
jgi:hypothetical protein